MFYNQDNFVLISLFCVYAYSQAQLASLMIKVMRGEQNLDSWGGQLRMWCVCVCVGDMAW